MWFFTVVSCHFGSCVIKDQSQPLIVTRCGYFYIDDGDVVKTLRPKGRKDYQILYIAEGQAQFNINGVKRIVKKGEMVLYRPFEPQYYFYYPKDKCQVFWVHFTGGEVEEILREYGFNEENIFYSGACLEYQWLFEQMIRELQLRKTNFEELLSLLLRHVFLLVRRYLVEGNKPKDTLGNMENSIRYFNEHYMEDINIEEYAKSLYLSPCSFNRKFKKEVKITPLQYVISLRIAKAKILLENKAYNVKQTAFAVGFNNPLYFSRIFTKHTGLSPTEYIKRVSEE